MSVSSTSIDQPENAESSSGQDTRKLDAIFNNSSIGIVVADDRGRMIDFNSQAERQFGYLKEEILLQPIELLIPSKYHRSHHRERTGFAQHPQDRVMGAGRDLYARRKDGTEFPVEISLNHYRNSEALYVIAFIVDISIRKKAQLSLLQQNEELEQFSLQVKRLNTELENKVEARTNMLKETLTELERSKDELRIALEKEKELGELKSRFVTMASHEFRTPLTAILSSSYIAQQYTGPDDGEKRERHLIKIQNAVKNLTFILEDFLSLGKFEEGQVQVITETVEEATLVAELESIADEIKNIARTGQTIILTHSSLPPLTTDKKLLRNILVNLLSNAIKYSPENSTITLSAVEEKGQVIISVADQGIGISETDQKHLFERFFRGSNTSAIQGTGLGLHIVGLYLRLIKGTIQVESQVGRGTTFSVVLDAKRV